MKVLGVIGAGKLGAMIGAAADEAGWKLLVNDVAPTEEMRKRLATRRDAALVDLDTLVRESAIILLAVPFEALDSLDWSAFDRKVVVDATNAWATHGGEAPTISTTASLRGRNLTMRLVKSFNHFSYHDYRPEKRAADIAKHRAMVVASDDDFAAAVVSGLVSDIGYTPIRARMDKAHLLDPNGPAFGVDLDAVGMRALLAAH